MQASETIEFVAGSYWTRERADASIARMRANLESPQMQALMRAIADTTAPGEDPAAAAASLGLPTGGEVAARATVIDRATCIVRRGRPDDAPALAALIMHGELPPFFIEEFIDGFCVVEQDGEIVACGGLEVYGAECAVIRSVVVHERGRGLGLGLLVSRLLMDDARAYGAKDVYLFTMHAAPFWRALGFKDTPLDAWRAEPRASWQYEWCATYPEAARDVISMWMPA
jgi:N-acetylglutamate synthase-like GNAT family acetyltransferase